MKKIILSLLFLMMMVSLSIPVKASTLSNWHHYRDHQNIVSSLTPQNAQETTVAWSKDFTEGFDNLSDLLIADDYLYFTTATGSKLLKVSLEDGSIVQEVALGSMLGYNVNIAYSDGMIFVPLGDNRIQAFDAKSLTSLWISEPVEGAIQSKLTIYDGYLYFGTYNWVGPSGNFYALTIKDENPQQKDEVKSLAWTYDPQMGGYNWAQAVIHQDTLYFAGSDGVLVAHALKDDQVYGTYTISGGVASPITLDQNHLYFTTTSGYIYSVQTTNTDTRIGHVISNVITNNGVSTSSSAPTIYNGRIYVGGGQGDWQTGQTGFITVFDAKTLKILYTQEVVSPIQSSPLVSTAYGDQVMVYFTMNGEPGGLYALVDDVNKNQSRIEPIYVPTGEASNYCVATPIADLKGNLYHYNDSGYLTKLSREEKAINLLQDQITKIDITGTFKEGTTLEVTTIQDQVLMEALKAKDPTLNEMLIYDLALFLEGNPYPLNQNVTVSIPVLEQLDETTLKLYSVNEQNIKTALDYRIENGKIVYVTNEFGTIMIADHLAQTILPNEEPLVTEEVKEESKIPVTSDPTNSLGIMMMLVSFMGMMIMMNNKKCD